MKEVVIKLNYFTHKSFNVHVKTGLVLSLETDVLLLRTIALVIFLCTGSKKIYVVGE